MSFFSRLASFFSSATPHAEHAPHGGIGGAAQLSYSETESTLTIGARSLSSSERDRFEYDRLETLQLALEAWRVNPIARRIVGLTSQYVVGGGISVYSKHTHTARFLMDFWEHPLNRMPTRVFEWCDELTRTGNLFILLSTDAAGMSYVRAVPATDIDHIDHQPNDIEQPTAFYPKASLENPDPKPYPAHDRTNDQPAPAGHFQTVMLHYTVNRPVGAQYGESDLAPILRWLSRYANWLEDRARLNRFRTAFLYIVKGRFTSENERLTRQRRLNTSPPSPGSILVTDEEEQWDVISPKLESDEAAQDGLALKKMIASGAGIPLHFLAEPESSTRTTAEAAGGPTYRHYEQRQEYFLWLLKDLLTVAAVRRAHLDKRIPQSLFKAPSAEPIIITGADISARDNVALSLASTNIINVLTRLRDRALIDDNELLRLVYRFAGESADVEDILTAGQKAPPPTFHPTPNQKDQVDSSTDPTQPQTQKSGKVDPKTGTYKQPPQAQY